MNNNFKGNIITLLWLINRDHKYKLNPEKVVDKFACKTGIRVDRVWSFINENEVPNETEIKAIKKEFDYGEDEIMYSVLFDEMDVNILKENIRYLLGQLAHGEKTDFARKVNININTIERWHFKGTRPNNKNIEKLKLYFDLEESMDLKEKPLFLNVEPVSVKQKKEYCIKQIEEMSVEEFSAVYHAIDKLLK